MKIIILNCKSFITLATFFYFATKVYGQNDFSELTTTTDSSFGYAIHNPIKLKKGNQRKSIDNSYKYLSGLKTFDNQTLELLLRATTDSPFRNESAIKINNRYTGAHISGKAGLLDKYIFLTSNTNDTIILFIDTYDKGELFLPVGLKYQKR